MQMITPQFKTGIVIFILTQLSCEEERYSDRKRGSRCSLKKGRQFQSYCYGSHGIQPLFFLTMMLNNPNGHSTVIMAKDQISQKSHVKTSLSWAYLLSNTSTFAVGRMGLWRYLSERPRPCTRKGCKEAAVRQEKTYCSNFRWKLISEFHCCHNSMRQENNPSVRGTATKPGHHRSLFGGIGETSAPRCFSPLGNINKTIMYYDQMIGVTPNSFRPSGILIAMLWLTEISTRILVPFS